ncbi:MAG: hypothetical protein AB7G75_05615 [Candidatus Binatia bacterium]
MSRLAVLFLVFLGFLEGEKSVLAGLINEIPDLPARTWEEEDVYPCCRLDTAAFPGIGTFHFTNRLHQSFLAWWGNDVAWWSRKEPGEVGDRIVVDLLGLTGVVPSSDRTEEKSISQVEDPASAQMHVVEWGEGVEQGQRILVQALTPGRTSASLAPTSAGTYRATLVRKEEPAMRPEPVSTGDPVPEAVYLLLVGAGLIGFGMLWNRYRRA